MAIPVGIDLGTTNSVIAAYEDGRSFVIPNAQGSNTTPSVVAFTAHGERLVGEAAQRQALVDPKGVISSAKRFIGRRFSQVSSIVDAFSFDVTAGRNDRVEFKIRGKTYVPEEVSGEVLHKLAEDASTYLKEQVTEAVITVPAYFSDAQRQATKDAAKIAGLKVLRIINEPTAAALGYGFRKGDKKTVLVFDLGGGTFDVSVLEFSGTGGDDSGLIQVRGTGGDSHLGGDDFDWLLASHLADGFQRQYGIDLREDPIQRRRLVHEAEIAKRQLSAASSWRIQVPNITRDNHLDASLTRSEFEDFTRGLIERCRGPVKQALKDAEVTSADIDDVILVGGSTRIPAVQNLVRELCGREPTKKDVKPDEVVALGAAIQAAIVKGDVTDTVLVDNTSLSLGIETYGGIFDKLIKRNSPIPTRGSKIFTTADDNQPSTHIQVFQGERAITEYNDKLGEFELPGIAPAPRGTPQIKVTFDIDRDSIVHVSARDLGTGTERDITITGSSTLKSSEVERMIADAERYRREDAHRRQEIEKLDTISWKVKRSLRDLGGTVAPDVRAKAEVLVADAKEALGGYPPVGRISYLALRLQESDESLNGSG